MILAALVNQAVCVLLDKTNDSGKVLGQRKKLVWKAEETKRLTNANKNHLVWRGFVEKEAEQQARKS